MSELGIFVSSANGDRLVVVTGELDLASAPELAAQLSRLRRPGAVVTVDLTAIRFIDVAGLRVLLAARAAARTDGWELRVLPTSPVLARLLELTETTHLLTDQLMAPAATSESTSAPRATR